MSVIVTNYCLGTLLWSRLGQNPRFDGGISILSVIRYISVFGSCPPVSHFWGDLFELAVMENCFYGENYTNTYFKRITTLIVSLKRVNHY